MEEYKPITKESFQVLGEGIEIGGLETQEYTIKLRYVDSPDIDQSADMNKEFSGYLSITEGKDLRPTLYAQLLQDNKTILTRNSFDTAFTEENIGTLYKASGNETEDVNGDGIGEDVYYFAGNALNNWVKFGKDQDNADLYWRIIRTNEDGSVRLLYVGPDPATESAFIKIDGVYMNGGSDNTGIYNSKDNNTMYVGYMYGSEGSLENNRLNITSSPIKIKTDEWYSKTLNVKTDIKENIYDRYISKTSIYCNDRSTDAYLLNDTMYYGPGRRLFSSKSPSFKCGNDENKKLYNTVGVSDKFSASTSGGGNGQLEYPIAQITADEIAYAGGAYVGSSLSWYYFNSIGNSVVNGDYWWTMSPFGFYNSRACVFLINNTSVNSGDASASTVNDVTPGIRPVLSLKSCIKVTTGDGSSTTPYEVTVDSVCASLEN